MVPSVQVSTRFIYNKNSCIFFCFINAHSKRDHRRRAREAERRDAAALRVDDQRRQDPKVRRRTSFYLPPPLSSVFTHI